MGLILPFVSCKKNKSIEPPLQYYGEPIASSSEYFAMHELFSFTSVPTISPNGRYLAYVVSASISIERKGIWIVDLQTGGKYKLSSEGISPTWSPDSERLCFAIGDLFIAKLKDNTIEQLTQNMRCLYPSWHPTDNKIVFNGTTVDGASAINVIDLSTKKIIQQVASFNIGLNAGGWIGTSNIILAKIDNVYRLIDMSTGEIVKDIRVGDMVKSQIVGTPAVSHDGKKIAFSANNGIYIVNIDGSNLQQLLFNRLSRKAGEPFRKGDRWIEDLCWDPDGKHIVYQQIEFDASKIAAWGSIMGEGHSTMYKIDVEKALQQNHR